MAAHECSKKISDDGWHWHPCSRPATVEHDGQWYCWQHDPEYIKAKAKRRLLAWEAEMGGLAAIHERRAHNAKLAALVTPKLAAMLEDVAEGITSGYDRMQREPARALAARIREALEAAE